MLLVGRHESRYFQVFSEIFVARSSSFRLALGFVSHIHVNFMSFFLLAKAVAGALVGGDDNDEGQQHVSADDPCDSGWLNPVAGHIAG